MSDLFSRAGVDENVPLAEQLRPQTPDEVIGQQHLLGPGKPLRLAFESGQPHSMILWGPPGVGKTTLARMMATQFRCEFIALSAVFSGIKEVREAVAQAEMWRDQGRRTILFVDEIHRFNKAQQDGFLPFVESGLLTFIGATTENPSFEVNSALLSRASVYVLKSLDEAELGQLFERACERALADLSFDAGARDRLVGLADGDARRLLNLLEQVRTAAHTADIAAVDGQFIEETVAQNLPFRQGRRRLLRPDFGPPQLGARLLSGCLALLAVPHARRRRRPALPGPAHCAHGLGRYWPGRSARCAGRRGCG